MGRKAAELANRLKEAEIEYRQNRDAKKRRQLSEDETMSRHAVDRHRSRRPSRSLSSDSVREEGRREKKGRSRERSESEEEWRRVRGEREIKREHREIKRE